MQDYQYIRKDLGIRDYQEIYDAMRQFTDNRNEQIPDEIWVTEHFPVFTQGLAGKSEHILKVSDIPIVQSNRGGQVTYHGPGQLIIYPLLNLNRLKIDSRILVTILELSTVETLDILKIKAFAKADAPGVYVNVVDAQGNLEAQKIASLGLRVRKGFSYHGLSLNVNLDLAPFLQINPCGYQGLKMTSLQQLGLDYSINEIADIFLEKLSVKLNEAYQNACNLN